MLMLFQSRELCWIFYFRLLLASFLFIFYFIYLYRIYLVRNDAIGTITQYV